MLDIPKIDDYLEIFIDEEVKNFVAINLIEYFKYITEEQNLRKVAKSLYNILTTGDNCTHHYNAKILNLSDADVQLINTKPAIKNKLKELLSKLKKLKVLAILVLSYKTINVCKISHSSTKLIASDSDIDEAFKSMHQSIMTKIKNYACEDWIVLDAIINHSIKIFE